MTKVRFRKSDVSRAVKGVLAAGIDVERVEVGQDGRIVILSKNAESAIANELDRWIAENANQT